MDRTNIKTRFGDAERVAFDSINEAVRWCEGRTSDYARSERNDGESSFNGRSWRDMAHALAHGDDKAARRVTEILDKVDASFRDREVTAWLPGLAGAYPIVPEYLAGHPECMRYRQPVTDDRSPLRIFVGICVSAGVDIETAQKRGAAAAALAMRLAEDRPVELYAFTDMRCNSLTKFMTYRIGTAPISAHEVAFALASIEALRRVSFVAINELCHANDAGIQWAFGKYPGYKGYLDGVREALGANPQDVVLPGGFMTEVAAMADNPVKWVHDKLEGQRQLDTAA